MAIYFNEYFGERLVAVFFFSFLQLTGYQALETFSPILTTSLFYPRGN